MDPTNIRELLDAHDKVPTKGEALQFKKSLGTNITMIAQRGKTKLFFLTILISQQTSKQLKSPEIYSG